MAVSIPAKIPILCSPGMVPVLVGIERVENPAPPLIKILVELSDDSGDGSACVL